jgi:hypothetical protein
MKFCKICICRNWLRHKCFVPGVWYQPCFSRKMNHLLRLIQCAIYKNVTNRKSNQFSFQKLKLKNQKSIIISERRDFRKKKIKRKKIFLGRDASGWSKLPSGAEWGQFSLSPRLILPNFFVKQGDHLIPRREGVAT